MRQQLSCSTILIGIALVIALFFFGFFSALWTEITDRPRMEQTADTIRATNAQIMVFLTQTAAARASTPTPSN